jgi:hypothetical protein
MTTAPACLAEIRSLARRPTPNPRIEDQLTIMQAVAHVAGRPISDTPRCTAPLLATFVTSWAGDLCDHERNRWLLPIIPELVDVRGGGEKYLATTALEWLVGTAIPAWLAFAGQVEPTALPADPPWASLEVSREWTQRLSALARFVAFQIEEFTRDLRVAVPVGQWVTPRLATSGEAAAAHTVAEAMGDDAPLTHLAQSIADTCGLLATFGSARAGADAIRRVRPRDGEEAAKAAVMTTYDPARWKRQASVETLIRRMVERVG